MGAGVNKRELNAAACEVLLGECDAASAIVATAEGFDLLPSNLDLTAAEVRLMSALAREQKLKLALAPIRDRYQYILIDRSEEHTSELQSLMRISYAVLCLKNKT